jgi:PKD repeat protein
MQKKHVSESGIFNPRLFLAVALCASGALLAMFSFASTPPTSSITVPSSDGQTVIVKWTGEIPPLANGSSDCANFADTPLVDQHLPTIHVPAGAYNNVKAKFTFNISWDGSSGNDEILTVLKPDGSELDSSDTGNPSETVTADNLPAGTYKVIACGFTNTSQQSYNGKLTITTSTGGPPPPPPTPAPTPSFAGGPRYTNYAPPPAVGENAGEPSIGYNLMTKRAMMIAGLQTLQVTFPEAITPLGSVPQACPADWKDVSYLVTKTKSLDPILFTDQRTGRTFVSQLDSLSQTSATGVLIGLNSLMAYTDDDGASWTPAQINPPDGSYDHQTVGAGPYPALVPLGNPINKGDAVYYCAQAGVTAFCSRSDDGGLNFGKAMTAYNAVTDSCGGIHGHVKVAPDGTVYLPDHSCGGKQAVAVSTDAGVTWTVRQVTTSTASPAILDPSVGIASDGTVYFSYINGDGHPHVAVSKDKGVTWINDRDIGIPQKIGNAVFVNAVAGDPLRAAVGFIGTTQTGDHEAADFNGTWYAFVAHTYDGGKTWTTVNATPNAPVQREACIWNEGGSNICRNLLDFNEITMDEKGRALYGYADGCINDCETGGPNSYSAKATIARQVGGKGLLEKFDPQEPTVPQRACLSGRRDDMASYLSWVRPDNGGSDITTYKIFRSSGTGAEALIGHQLGTKNSFTDRNVDPTVKKYTYRITAVSANGEGLASNPVELSITPRLEPTGACSKPGVTVVSDPVGDESDTVTEHDITSVSMAEPLDNTTTGAASKLVFTMKVVDLSTVPPGWRWSVRFTVEGVKPPDDASGGPADDFFVAMNSDGPTPSFTWGVTSVPQGAARVFTTEGNLDPASKFTTDGTITLVLPKSVIHNPAPGTAIAIELASVRAYGLTGGTNETIPDSTGGGGYALRATNLCLPNAAPIARIMSNIDEGPKPLTVKFDGSLSYDTDFIDTIGSYTFNFDDGGDDVTQGSPVISHTFTSNGEYAVRLVVKDSRGKVSSNTDQLVVEVRPNQIGGTPTPTPSPTASPSATAAPGVQLRNISGRVVVQPGDKAGIAGFIIEGATSKRIIVRGLGPSLKSNGKPVAGALQDPLLELHDAAGQAITNDNWRSSQQAEIQQTGIAPSDDRESAIVKRLAPGNYTAVLHGARGSSGIGLVEVYDLDAESGPSELGNLSVRAQVLTKDDVLIDGIIIGSGSAKRVVLRAIGPELHFSGVSGELHDPVLELHDGNGALLENNDNWKQASNATQLQATTLAPTDDRESAILTTLGPGKYTAIVRGKNDTTGIALAEVYKLQN